jgi:hypothetical protein
MAQVLQKSASGVFSPAAYIGHPELPLATLSIEHQQKVDAGRQAHYQLEVRDVTTKVMIV